MKCRRGAVLFETLLLLGCVLTVLFAVHLDVLKRHRDRLEALQKLRLRYDGSHP